jgi:hypothetical protein
LCPYSLLISEFCAIFGLQVTNIKRELFRYKAMINQSNIFKKIGNILNELQDQYQFLSENPEQLSELELELFLANANFLSDHVEIVRKMNNNKSFKELPQPAQEAPVEIIRPVELAEPIVPTAEPLIEEIEREELHQEDLSPSFEFIIDQGSVSNEAEENIPEVEVIEEEPVAEPFLLPSEVTPTASTFEESRQELPRQEHVQPSFQSELVPDKVEEKVVVPQVSTPVPDKVEEKVVQPVTFRAPVETPQSNPAHRPTLNDLLSGKTSQNSAEENAKPPITDLKRSITLNEKLLYIKDLFNGYNLAYSEAIDLINKMPDFKTADAFLQNNYAAKNNWEAKQSTVAQFYDLLKQRFPEA